MDLGFSLIIMFKQVFLSRPLKLYEFSTGSSRINSRPTNRLTDLAIILHINLKKILMWKNWISPWQRLVGVELMRVEISLFFYSFSDVVVGRENRDQLPDGGGNTMHYGYVSRGQWMLWWVWLKYINANKFSIRRGKATIHTQFLKVKANRIFNISAIKQLVNSRCLNMFNYITKETT